MSWYKMDSVNDIYYFLKTVEDNSFIDLNNDGLNKIIEACTFALMYIYRRSSPMFELVPVKERVMITIKYNHVYYTLFANKV